MRVIKDGCAAKLKGRPAACQRVESCVLAQPRNQMLTHINQAPLFIGVGLSREWHGKKGKESQQTTHHSAHFSDEAAVPQG